MKVSQNTLDHNDINAKDLRQHLKNIMDISKESDGVIVTAHQSIKAKNKLELLGDPIYTTFLVNHHSDKVIPNELYNLAIILDYLYMTEDNITLDVSFDGKGRARRSIRCDRENFYVADFKDDITTAIKESRVQEVTIEDLAEKFKLYYSLLTYLSFNNDIDVTKDILITRLRMKRLHFEISFHDPLSDITRQQLESAYKTFDTWINDIEKM